jgi:hypothetical protein
MRVTDPIGGPPNLKQFIRDYDEHFRNLDRYEYHLLRLTAGYSRAEPWDEVRREFAIALEKVVATDESIQAKDGPDQHVFSHRGRHADMLRDALVLLSFGLCLRVSRNDIKTILACCDRGDSLLETLARAAAPGEEKPSTGPAFPKTFEELYAALEAPEQERERCISAYLKVWYSTRMEGFAFKDTHKIHDRAIYVGYWCFEAAGVVAALDIDDRSFAGHPHYPKDLVAYYRQSKSAKKPSVWR